MPGRRASAVAEHLPPSGPGGARIDSDHDALVAELLGRFADQFGARDRGRVDAALVRARQQKPAHVGGRADAAADRQRQKDARRGLRNDVEDRIAVLVACGYIEEGQFIGTSRIIECRLFHRITGIPERDEIDTLHDPPVLHVQAGDHAQLQHGDTGLIDPVL